MSFTPTFTYGGQGSGSAAFTKTLTIPAHSAVVVLASQTSSSATGPGTLVDSNSVSYSVGNYDNNAGDGYLYATFYVLDSGSAATSLTWTPTSSYSALALYITVLAVTATPTLVGTYANIVHSPSTATDGVTTGAFSITTGDGIVCSAFGEYWRRSHTLSWNWADARYLRHWTAR